MVGAVVCTGAAGHTSKKESVQNRVNPTPDPAPELLKGCRPLSQFLASVVSTLVFTRCELPASPCVQAPPRAPGRPTSHGALGQGARVEEKKEEGGNPLPNPNSGRAHLSGCKFPPAPPAR